MSQIRSLSFLFILALGLQGCVSPSKNDQGLLVPGDPSAPSSVTPKEAIVEAQRYCTHSWQPFARNIRHGFDSNRIRVDTPDASYHPPSGRNGWWLPGEVNEGIPYKWGGFDSLSSFDEGVNNGLAAGDVSTPAKRVLDNAAVSRNAVGLDCSGFVSRCLKLPEPYDSARLPSICQELSGPDQLRAGDLLNFPHRHVILVAGWGDKAHTLIYFYETGGIPEWKPALKICRLDQLIALGYKPLRYRGMAREQVPSGKEILTRAMQTKAVFIKEPEVGDP